MPSIAKPAVVNPALPKNAIGLTVRDYEGGMSTLCAGCGHDSITGALVQALWELAMPPRKIAKLSGIGCSAKTIAYFSGRSHGFNTVHGRMAPIATGASAANRDLLYVGVSGDGDSLSIGMGHLVHLIRRNVRMMYLIENNGDYGLTKGQFSASADIGSTAKKGAVNRVAPIDPMLLGLSLGASFLARSFSGDKKQLIPILKAAANHKGLALIDIISPCVTFNDHEGSTKSYLFTREHEVKITQTDFVPPMGEIVAPDSDARLKVVTMHDGSEVRFSSVPGGYDPTDARAVAQVLAESHQRGEVVTGLLYIDEKDANLHDLNQTSATPLVDLPYERLNPGSAELAKFGFR